MSDNPARVQLHRCDSDIAPRDKEFSVHVSRTMDILGKSQNMVKYRVKMHKELQRLDDVVYAFFKTISAGSKGVGLTAPFESDSDVMYVFPDIVCSDNARKLLHYTVLQTERQDTPAGYTKLNLVHNEGEFSRHVIQNSIVRDNKGDRYISSDLFLTFITSHLDNNEYNLICHERSGPSFPTSDQTGNIQVDAVLAFTCACPELLQAFLTRPRRYNRPAKSILNDISKLEAHVVPVGCKESETCDQEWRICFTEAEIHLIHSFGDIETKLYILLKMISKILKAISSDITSYVMKNIVLWIVELHPEELFTEELLTTQLIRALVFFKKCVEANYLPSYMIPERNLLGGKTGSSKKTKPYRLFIFINKRRRQPIIEM